MLKSKSAFLAFALAIATISEVQAGSARGAAGEQNNAAQSVNTASPNFAANGDKPIRNCICDCLSIQEPHEPLYNGTIKIFTGASQVATRNQPNSKGHISIPSDLPYGETEADYCKRASGRMACEGRSDPAQRGVLKDGKLQNCVPEPL